MGKVESAAQFMEQICNDNSHGYSMQNRWGEYGDYDCSSLVITCYEQAGVPVKTKGATYTGNMYNVFLSCGFKDVTSKCDLYSGSGMKRGDVLLNYVEHTAMYLGNGRVGHARSSEGNSCPGDQSGNEIRTQSYWNYPWNCVLRYEEENSFDPTPKPPSYQDVVNGITSDVQVSLPTIQRGSRNRVVVAMLQGALGVLGFNVGPDGADGDFGRNTDTALRNFQKKKNLSIDGVCGPNTWKEILKGD